jgi:anti-sigma-K factor RskA
MYDDDRDALAAEYVLGTLSVQEREEAETLLAKDAGFAETVKLWEHRLGELNVMVEAVEPPPDLWERIKSSIDGAERRSELAVDATPPGEQLESAQAVESPLIEAAAEASPERHFETVSDLLAERGQRSEESTVAALASTLLPPDLATEFDDHLPKSPTAAPQRATHPEAKALDQNARRWRGLAIAMGAIAVVLAAYVGAAQFAPGLIATARQTPSQSTSAAAKRSAAPQLVAVLQQEPTPPAFLIMLDSQERTITIRRLTAAPDGGRNYELWMNSAKSPKPVSLGLIGNGEFSSRPIPPNTDIETMLTASYSVSLEPGGGSPSGAPTGPMLFKGRMIEASPGPPG